MIPLIVIGIIFIYLVLTWVVLQRVVKAGPNEVFVISGRTRMLRQADGTRFIVGFRVLKGGRTFIWPFIERVDRLSLEPFNIDFKIPRIQIADGKTIMFDGMGVIKIDRDDLSIAYAAENFLSMDNEQIAAIAIQIIEGHLRNKISLMTVEEIISGRPEISNIIHEAAGDDLKNLGLNLVSFSIREIDHSDSSGQPLKKITTVTGV